MRPRVGLRNLVSILKQVVLPAPLGPIKAWMVRRLTRRLTPLTAINPANSLVKSSVSRIMSLLIQAPNGDIVGALRRMSRPHNVQFWRCIMGSAAPTLRGVEPAGGRTGVREMRRMPELEGG